MSQELRAIHTCERFGLYLARLAADSGYGSTAMLGWLAHEQDIEPLVGVFDKAARRDGTFQCSDFTFDHAGEVYFGPAGKMLATNGRLVKEKTALLYRASTHGCGACYLKERCCPNASARKIPRSRFEGARDMAREIMDSGDGRVSKRQRKQIEMLSAHLKHILKPDRLCLRGPNGARDEFHLATTAQKLRKTAKLIPMSEQAPA